MAAGSIVVDLMMKTGSFETDTARAEKRLRELKKEAEQMGVAIGAAFTAVGVASAVMVKHAINVADEMGKMAQKVGTTVEELSALAYVANLTGPSQEQLGQAMVKLSKNMSDAAQGTGEAGKAFAALGLNVKNQDGTLKSSSQVITEIAEKFAGYRDGAEKTALAVELFGRAGAELIPLLNVGAAGINELTDEARQLGVVLDTDTAKAAEAFNDNLTRMGAAVSGVANKAAVELLPALNSVSEMLVSVAKNEASVEVATGIVKAAVGGLITIFQTIAVVGSDVGFVFLTLGRTIGGVAAAMGALATGNLEGFATVIRGIRSDSAEARAELDKFQAKVMSIGVPAYRDPRLLGDVPSIASQTAGWKPAAPQIAPNVPRPRAAPRAKAEKPEKPYETSDKYSEADALAMEARMLNEAQQAWAKYADVAVPVLENVNVQLTDSQNLLMDMGASGLRAFEDLATGTGKFSNVLKGLLQDISRMIFQLGVAKPLMGMLSNAIGAGTPPPQNPNVPDTSFSWANLFSTIGSSFFGGPRAAGGPVSAGTPYLIGERGPEMFVPRTAGMVVPNHALAGGSGPPVIINQTTGRVDQVQQQTLPDGREAWFLQELSNPNSKTGRILQKRWNMRPAR